MAATLLFPFDASPFWLSWGNSRLDLPWARFRGQPKGSSYRRENHPSPQETRADDGRKNWLLKKGGTPVAPSKEAALSDAQDLAEILLDAECRLGEMLAPIPPKRDKQGSTQRTSLPSLPDGIDKKQSHEAQQLSKHRDIVERCKAEARETGGIVTSRRQVRRVALPGPHAPYKAKCAAAGPGPERPDVCPARRIWGWGAVHPSRARPPFARRKIAGSCPQHRLTAQIWQARPDPCAARGLVDSGSPLFVAERQDQSGRHDHNHRPLDQQESRVNTVDMSSLLDKEPVSCETLASTSNLGERLG